MKVTEQPRRKSTGGFGMAKGRENAATPTPQTKHKHNENLTGFTHDKITTLEMPVRLKEANPSLISAKA